jgi:hypothetical protein
MRFSNPITSGPKNYTYENKGHKEEYKTLAEVRSNSCRGDGRLEAGVMCFEGEPTMHWGALVQIHVLWGIT